MSSSNHVPPPSIDYTATTNSNAAVTEMVPLVDDADIAAGKKPIAAPQHQQLNPTTSTTPPTSSGYNYHNNKATTNNNGHLPPRSATTSLGSLHNSAASQSVAAYQSDLEFFEDLVSEPVLVLGVDISHLDRNSQFLVCAAGVFGFSLLYGYLQELISVRMCSRQLGLFLAMVQFTGYTVLAFVMRNFVYQKQQRQLRKQQHKHKQRHKHRKLSVETQNFNKKDDDDHHLLVERGDGGGTVVSTASGTTALTVPLVLYLGLSILRAIDLGMTNLAMQYINYPAKTLMKSSRVVFTMLFGVVISRKSYKLTDYGIVFAMVAGLALFMHADANSSAVFDLAGVLMLTVSLLCDGAISNVSETIMSKFNVGQDEFIFRMYSIALVAVTLAAAVKGDLTTGFAWLFQPGAYDELDKPLEERTWTVAGKITVMVLFSSMGFFGSSCAAAITKNFGALTMSITSTARKAATLFLSFFLFNNVCTLEHILGVIIFIAALTAKSLRRSRSKRSSRKHHHHHHATTKRALAKRRLQPDMKRKTSISEDSSVASSSVVSDISDVELQLELLSPQIPSVVHTKETLRSRVSATSPAKAERNQLVTTL